MKFGLAAPVQPIAEVRYLCPRRLEHLLLPSKKLVIVMNIKTNGTFPTTKIAKTVTKLFSKAALKAIQSMTLAHFWNSMTMKIGKIIKTNGVKHAQLFWILCIFLSQGIRMVFDDLHYPDKYLILYLSPLL